MLLLILQNITKPYAMTISLSLVHAYAPIFVIDTPLCVLFLHKCPIVEILNHRCLGYYLPSQLRGTLPGEYLDSFQAFTP